jgi:chromosomal replication initiation ATPase DnaA
MRTRTTSWASNVGRRAIERTVSGATTRPVGFIGPSGSGKTAHLREAFQQIGVEPRWITARDAFEGIIDALRDDRYDRWREGFENDPRPLVMEHVEDLRGKQRTMEELRHLLDVRQARGNATVLTLTLGPRVDEVVAWLRTFSELIAVRASASGTVRA